MLTVVTNCAREFNIEPDVLKYQTVMCSAKKIEFWDRKRIDGLLDLVASLRRCYLCSDLDDKMMSGEN